MMTPREIDKLIGVKVFNWRYVEGYSLEYKEGEGISKAYGPNRGYYQWPNGERVIHIPKYSEDPDDAREVSLIMQSIGGETYEKYFSNLPVQIAQEKVLGANTPNMPGPSPLEICMAALIAVGAIKK